MENFDYNDLAQKALKTIRSLAKGNGAQEDAVQLRKTDYETIKCEAITHLELHPDITAEEKKGRVKGNNVFSDAATLEKAINDYAQNAIKNPEVRKIMANSLLERPDKGFSSHSDFFDLPQLTKSFSLNETCRACEGQGQSTCRQCSGRRQEQCYTCHGNGITPCTYCHATGTTQDANGTRHPCNQCRGTSQMTCRICQRKGQVLCRQCKATGAIKCNNCKGLGVFSKVHHVQLQMKTVFEIDRAALPHPAVRAIERSGSRIVEKKHIRVQGEQVKREDGGLAIQYSVEFPYAYLMCGINGQPLKVELFGYNGKIIKVPAFIENMIGTNLSLLERAAEKENTHSNIIKASKTRIIGEALSLSLNLPKKAGFLKLKKRYPVGVSNEGLKHLIFTSQKAIKQLTSKSRHMGYMIAAVLSLGLNGAYFFSGIREIIAGAIGIEFISVVDLLLIAIGVLVGNIITKKMIQSPLQKALGHLSKNPKPKKVVLWPIIIISIVTFAVTILGALLMGQISSWPNF